MAHILTFPIPPRLRSPRHPADTLTVDSAGYLERLFEDLRSAWWDGSSLALSRVGLAALVGLEPGDATPRRRASR